MTENHLAGLTGVFTFGELPVSHTGPTGPERKETLTVYKSPTYAELQALEDSDIIESESPDLESVPTDAACQTWLDVWYGRVATD